jgi:hypothetical protein
MAMEEIADYVEALSLPMLNRESTSFWDIILGLQDIDA